MSKGRYGVANVEAQMETLRERIAPAVAALDVELYDVELTGAGKARTLRVTVTRPDGIDLDAITEVTHAISPIVDDAPAPAGPFLLEVSSPGLERTLRTPAHYAGATGAAVSVKVRSDAGTRRVQGVLLDADDDHFTVEVDRQPERFAYADVTQARTVFEWGPPPRPGKRRAAKTSKGVTA